MSWFFRVVHLSEGQWQCRFGRTVFDAHPSFDEALQHISTLAAAHRPATVVAHLPGQRPTPVAEFE